MSDSDDDYDPLEETKNVAPPPVPSYDASSSNGQPPAGETPLPQGAQVEGGVSTNGGAKESDTTKSSFPQSNQTLMASNANHTVELWPFVPVEVFRHGNEKAVTSISISPADGRSVVTSGRDGIVAWFEQNVIERQMREYETRGTTATAATNAGGQKDTSSGNKQKLGTFFSNGLPTTRTISPFINRVNQAKQAISAVAWSNDGSYLVACEDGDCPVLITSRGQTGEPLPRGQRNMLDALKAMGHRGSVTCCDTAATNSAIAVFATGSKDGTVRVWEAKNNTSRQSSYAIRHGSGKLTDQVQVSAVKFLPNSSTQFISGGSDGKIQLWDTKIPQAQATKPIFSIDCGAQVAGLDIIPETAAGAPTLIAVRTLADDLKIFDLNKTIASVAVTGAGGGSLRSVGTSGGAMSRSGGFPPVSRESLVAVHENLPVFGDFCGVSFAEFEADGSRRLFTVTSNQMLVGKADGVMQKGAALVSIGVGNTAATTTTTTTAESSGTTITAHFPIIQVIPLDHITPRHGVCVEASGLSNQVYVGTSDGSVVAFYRPAPSEKDDNNLVARPGVAASLSSYRRKGDMIELMACWRGSASKRGRDAEEDD